MISTPILYTSQGLSLFSQLVKRVCEVYKQKDPLVAILYWAMSFGEQSISVMSSAHHLSVIKQTDSDLGLPF